MEQASCKEYACNSPVTGRCRSVQRAGLIDEKQGSRGRHAGQAPSRRAARIAFSSTAASRPLTGLAQLQATWHCPLNSRSSACHRPPSQQLSTPTLWPQGAKAVKASGSAHTMQMSSMAAGRLVPQ